ncbi:eukaryotic translation initiation factor 3 subunit C [Saccoglossus kowalevskii]|uniref:Eukaryotic translation initiation factor 3 subunit C n=1 Tax=Saccoglossus kowalevskii TaxID=10224 RepID=A0ABM0GGX2_SACKO|nr:eukaryotic translation initiation factor 3 subunit C [Saccoglossus kowalevskii]
MSRFFATGSSTESSSDESDDDIAPVQQKPAAPAARVFMFSDEEEDTKRVVRSAKDKRFDEIKSSIKQIKNHKKIKDIAKVLSGFEDLCKVYLKAKNIIEKEGHPRFYIKYLVELEDFVNECWEDKKKFNKINAKSLGTLRQKYRKYCRDYEKQITDYKANPDASGEEDEVRDDEDTDSDSDDEISASDFLKKSTTAAAPVVVKAPPVDKVKFLKTEDSGDESDDSYWDSSSGDSSSSSEEEGGYTGASVARQFLKKGAGDEKKEKEKRERKKREGKRKEEEEDDEEGGWEEVKGGYRVESKPKMMFEKDTEITTVVVVKKLNEILSARGKRGTDRSEQIELLKELRSIAVSNNLMLGIDVKILFSIIASIYDYNPNIATNMKSEMWEKCLMFVSELLDILIENGNVIVGENIAEETENLDNVETPFRVRGCVLTLIERLDEEFTKMLQGCDAHSYEYVERLKDESKVLDIIVRVQKYIEERGTSSEMCRIFLRHIEHIYYKYDYENLKKIQDARTGGVKDKEEKEETKKEESKNEEEGESKAEDNKDDETDNKVQEENKKDRESSDEKKEESSEKEETSSALMDRMCKFIYSKDSTDMIRTRAILCHIYHHALHDRWFQARDLMLMSHLQDTIHHADVPTQIRYNRSMVQLGLCAFRAGNIRDAHNALLDIQSGGRAKELLAQGLLMRSMADRNPEQEKIEKRRQVPFHMHINLELLECVYLVSAMLLEIPYMAAHEFDTRKRMISKSFHHQLRLSERQALLGPPESMREHVVAASKAMKTGNWKACRNFLINEKMNGKVWNLFPESETVRALIVRKIQEESLRTYLFTFGSVYESLSLSTLSEMFELEKHIVHSTISKMIINEELMASWDEPSECVVMHRCEPTRLQSMALQLSEKVSILVESNEKQMEMKQGNFYHRQQNRGDGQQQRDYQNKSYGGRRGQQRQQRYN